MVEDSLLQEAVEYFKARPGFERLLQGFRRKYISLGRLGGKVKLRKLKNDEIEALSGFYQKDLSYRQSITMSVQRFQELLAKTRFGDLKLLDILEAYFEESLMTNKERALADQERELEDWQWWYRHRPQLDSTVYFDRLYPKSDYLEKYFKRCYRDFGRDIFKVLDHLLKALEILTKLQNEGILLADLGTQVSLNPHYFDTDTLADRILTAFLREYFRWEVSGPLSAELRAELYYQAGILVDGLSNRVLVYQVELYDNRGQAHPGIEGYNQTKEANLITLSTLYRWPNARSLGARVYVCENPTLFQYLIDALQNNEDLIQVSLVCGNGQLQLATLKLFDSLVRSNVELVYGGDFDPEGFLIADRLRQRYPGQCDLWLYDTEHYRQAMSKEKISETRLRKLDQLKDPIWLELIDQMQTNQLAAYQEQLMPVYWEDMMNREIGN